ncbi:cache domain-containing protein [Pseudobacteriovorax antillogorgiicola]|uniref:Methyl-accepting chemotaxis protein n=1 Tax=Pseudobacteriovorax antillogorgiicola TaxID=1513793 RepID=A0A1Y6BAA9_9BACT|nr:cache domain-containing protein [Pseudobacteriovorax antillogorgiicola]TCS57431.1 methyl-accepting chemotaxis protein [Pseudobacteriovorax antillogorgiicola]SMF01198.1 methyl-accepting chemotaxis protein [Pseudobacteriovorax antillogorgiicola]
MLRQYLIICLGFLGISLSSAGFAIDCEKEQAKQAVLDICSKIESNGKSALKDVAKFRYCGSNYVWVQDSNVKMVLHPIKPRLNGRDLTKNKDEKGKLLFVEFDKAAKSNAGGDWVNYVWAKPGAEKATPKVSFVKRCGGDLGWVAGSGIWK